jgi:predicted porin
MEIVAMKKSLIALATLTAFAGAASAQSSVTLGGKLDLGIGKAIGSADKGLQDAAGSRVFFLINEDLGGGLRAIGGFEHRFNPDDGTQNSGNMWNGFSWVGFQGGFGRVTMGRMYTSAFTGFGAVQNQIDPWGGDTVAALRGVGMLPGGVAKIRNANALRYDLNSGGFNFSFDIGEAGKNNTGAADATVVDRPMSFGVNYAAGPLFVGVSMENPGGAKDKLTNFGARYRFGAITLRAGGASGTQNTGTKVKGQLLAANMALGSGDLRAGYATTKVGTATTVKRASVGYKYDLSKRTYLYMDVTKGGGTTVTTQKSGYDFGVQHNF